MTSFSSPPPSLPQSLADAASGDALGFERNAGGDLVAAWKGAPRLALTDAGAQFLAPVLDMAGNDLAPPLGMAGETWQDMRGSRVDNTAYQNTTGRPIEVSIFAIWDFENSNASERKGGFEVSLNGSDWVAVYVLHSEQSAGSWTVSPGSFYRLKGRLENQWINSDFDAEIYTWSEFRA